MNPAIDSSQKPRPDAAVYDPSCRRAETGSYWQWSNVKLNARWNRIAECVNKGWPAGSVINGTNKRWYGALRTSSGDCWVYRLYAAGRDRFGRDGRYFFALAQFPVSDVVAVARVAGLFDYFDNERSLPLKTESLSKAWPDAAPDSLLRTISEDLGSSEEVGHWGIDDSGRMVCFMREDPFGAADQAKPSGTEVDGGAPSKQPILPKPSPRPGEGRKGRKPMIALLAAAVLAMVLVLVLVL